MKKIFRVVPLHGSVLKYRVDEQHAILFGLIKWWDRGSSSLSPYYNFQNAEDIVKTIKEQFPKAKLICGLNEVEITLKSKRDD